MESCTSRVGCWPLALALVAVAACADDPPTTAPRATPTASSLQALDGNVILVTNSSGTDVPGSLSWAVGVASGGSVIQFADSLAGDTIALNVVLDAVPDITVQGPATEGITITSNAGRIFHLRQGGVLRNLTLSGGSDGPGSAVWTQGPVLLEHTTVTNSHGASSAIHGHQITLVNSTVSGNTGGGPASGITVASDGSLMLINSTVAHNDGAPGIGWQMSPGGPPWVTLRNSIVANNYGGFSPDCDSYIQFEHQGMNIASDSSCGVSPGMLIADPMLAGLDDNGGPTPTERFDHRSPALNRGVNCNVTVDQRYVSRDAKCDIGAFEFTDFTIVTLTINANAVTAAPNGLTTVTGTVSCSRAGDQFGVAVELQQEQKAGKSTTVVRGTGSTGITCTTSAQPWSAAVTATAGAFVTGAASATATTTDVPVWITPSSASRAVKLVRPPRR